MDKETAAAAPTYLQASIASTTTVVTTHTVVGGFDVNHASVSLRNFLFVLVNHPISNNIGVSLDIHSNLNGWPPLL